MAEDEPAGDVLGHLVDGRGRVDVLRPQRLDERPDRERVGVVVRVRVADVHRDGVACRARSRAAVRRRSISANASSQLTSTCAPSRRTSGRRSRSGSSWSAPSVEPLGQMNPCENGSSASPRMRVTWPSSTSSCSPHVASQSGHVLNAIRVIPRRYNPQRPIGPRIRPRRPARGAPRGRRATRRRRRCTRRSRGSGRRARACACGGCPRTSRRKPRERRAGALVERVRLELDAAAAEDVERVLQLEELRLRVRARAPGRRRQPRPADLEAPVLGAQREEPGRADGASRGDEHRGERQIEPVVDACERVVHPRLPLVPGLRLDDRQPPPDPRVARRLPAGRRRAAGASGSSRTIRPSSVGVSQRSTTPGQYTRDMPIYEYACMECEDHFDELVRSDDQVITCPSCNADGRAQADLRLRRARRGREAVVRRQRRWRLLRRRLRLRLGTLKRSPASRAAHPRRPSASPPRLAGRWTPRTRSAALAALRRRDCRVHELSPCRDAQPGRLRLRQPRRRADDRRRGARLPRGPGRAPVRRTGRRAARAAARRHRARAPESSTSRTCSSAGRRRTATRSRRDRGLRAAPVPPDRARPAPRRRDARQLRHEAPLRPRRSASRACTARSRRSRSPRTTVAALPALSPGSRALYAVDAEGAGGRLRPHARPARHADAAGRPRAARPAGADSLRARRPAGAGSRQLVGAVQLGLF